MTASETIFGIFEQQMSKSDCAYMRSLVSTFVVRYLEGILAILFTS